ncbi:MULTISPECIES: hypothetical protein [unclassified Pseudoalteromonas]|uniref:hypothetical protein n=1 Tax=unclassified Pseudoalteromonas TaxID=194690 RepID=UPI000CF6E7DF|nr:MULTISPECIES: hypothetical protein [unclassified Pseudoalteromonas]
MKVKSKVGKPQLSKKQEKLFQAIALAMCVLVFPPLFGGVFVNEELARALAWLSLPLTLALIALLTYALFKKSFRKKLEQTAGKFGQYFVLPVAYLLIPFFVYFPIAIGIPTLLHHICYPFANSTTLVLTIDRKGSSHKPGKWRCRGSIWLKEYQLPTNGNMCGMNSLIWGLLSPGDKITVYGKETVFGFSYDGYKLHTLQGKRID